MNEELLRLRRRIRVLGALSVLLVGLAAYGWLRSPGDDSERLVLDSPEDAQRLRERLDDASHAERLRLLHQLGRSGGQQATSAIIELLRNARTSSERRLAVSQLGQICSPQAIRELAELARSAMEKRPLRRAAVAGIGGCRSEPGIEQLMTLLEESADPSLSILRNSVIYALGESGGQRATERLIELCGEASNNETERLAAIAALGKTGNADAALPALLGLARTGRLVVRKAAVAALGSVGTPEAKRALIRFVQSGTRGLRATAVVALGQYSGDDVQVLLASASASKDASVAAAAIGALGEDNPLGQQALSRALASSQLETRRAAVRALGKSASPESTSTLVGLLGDSALASEAATQLGELGTPEARQALLSAVRADAPLASQHAALSALSQLQGEDVQRSLSALVKSGSPQVAAQALRQLARRKGPGAKEDLIAAYRDGNRAVRSAAITALAELGDPSTKQVLLQAARSGDYQTAYGAVSGLAKLPRDEAHKILVDLVKTGPTNVGTSAAQQLARLGGDEARATLIASLKDKDSGVNTSWALSQMRDDETRRQLHEILDDPSQPPMVKQRVLYAMRNGGDSQGLLAAATNPDKKIAVAALGNLAAVGGAEAERTLLDALGSGDVDKKQSAVAGLTGLGTPKAIKALGQSLQDKDTFHSSLAALTQIGGKQAMGAITDLYRTSEPTKRQQIISRLYNSSSSSQARSLLETALGDDDEQVVASAATALARHGDPQVKGRMLALMQSSPSKRVRYSIAMHLRYNNSRTYRNYKSLIDEILQAGRS